MSIRCGPHVHRGPGETHTLAAAIEAARKVAADAGFEMAAASLFVGGPKKRVITLDAGELPALRGYLRQTGIRVIAHGAYVDAPFKGDPSAGAFIRKEAEVCIAAGIAGLVVHLPKLPVASVIKYAGRMLVEVPEGADFRVYLETPAFPGDELYDQPESLADMFRELRAVDPGGKRLGLCVDTAHLHVAGIDLSAYAAADNWFRRLEARSADIPPEAIVLHLNDAVHPRGRGPDRHEALLRGAVWGDWAERPHASGLAAVLDYATRNATTMILERKPDEKLISDYHILRELVPALRVQ
jgi:endonuclease IV